MSIQTFFKSLASNSTRRRPVSVGRSLRDRQRVSEKPAYISRPVRRSPLASRLRLEPLEDRRLLSFSPAVDYPVGVNPIHVVSADFNSDGRLDLATANASLSVMLGNADGTFQPAQTTDTPAVSLAVGDFNADGKLDLATADGSANVGVRLGNGNGTFQAPTSIDIGSLPQSVAVGDFNADGKLDLGVTSNVYYPGYQGYYGWYPGYYAGRANVLLGNGAGSFSPSSSNGLGLGHFSSAVVADFNGDGKQDFAAAQDDGSVVVAILGYGNGALGPNAYFSVGYGPSATTAGDVNGDGKVDLVTANQGNNNVGVLLGTGDGSFAAAQFYPAGGGPFSVALGDFNGDGKVDLVTANSAAGAVGVLLGAGDGTFRPPVSIAAGAWPTGVAVGDFNGDGRLDAATANHFSNNVSVLLNDGNWPPLGAPSITINDVTVTEGNTGTTAATFTVRLSAAYGQTVTVHYATADGSATLAGGDYQAASGDVVFAPGVTSQTITVLANGDRLAESSESFYVRLTNPTNAIVVDASGTGTIVDDEPYVSIGGNVQVAEGNTGTTSAVYNVSLSQAYDVPVNVNFSTAEGDTHFEGGASSYGYYYYAHTPAATSGIDFQAQMGTLTFAAGQTSKNITVAVNGDRHAERLEYFSVNLTNPSANASIGDDHALGTIADDEPAITVNSPQIVEGNSGTTDALITLSMAAASDGPVTVDWFTADYDPSVGGAIAGSDYLASSGTVTFALGGPLTQTIAVPILGDRLFEYYEPFLVNLSNYSWGYQTISDDEPVISISSYVGVDEGDTGTTPAVFVVSLAHTYDQPISVNFSTSEGGSDFQTQSGLLVIPAGQTSANITVAVYGDTLIEETEYFAVDLSGASANAVIYNSHAIGIIIDDDEPMTKFYVVDASSDKTFEYDDDGQSVENYRLRSGNNNSRGAASDASGERVWVIDDNDNVYVYDDAGNSLGYWKAKGLSTPEGIASDGTDIWIVDRGSDRVYRYAGAANRTSGSANATSSFTLNSGNKDARGIETDGTHLWVVNDSSTNKVFKYTLSGALVGSWTIGGTNTTPTGITLDPSNPSDIWIVDADRDQVFQYTAAAGRTSGSQSSSAVFNLAAGNTNPQGIADPPPVGQSSSLTETVVRVSSLTEFVVPIPSLIQSAWKADLLIAAAPRSEEAALALPQRPLVSAALSTGTFARSGTISEVVWDDQEQESFARFHRRAFHAYDAVFADAERLSDILNDDWH